MHSIRRFTRPLSYVLAPGLLAVNVHWSAASAALIGSDTVLGGQQVGTERVRIGAGLAREEVRAALLAAGADPDAVAARVAALTDDEVRALAARMDEMPAGGDGLGVIAFIFVVLLITDILGFT